jgi:predicted transcriptional regulator
MHKQILKVATLALCLVSLAFASDAFPHINGQTLGERAVVLPDAFKGKPTILVVTFTRAAQEQARVWTDKLKQRSLRAPTYQVLELEDVPRLMRGFVRGSIRRGIPKESQDSFVLLFEAQDALKKVVGFNAQDDAYVVLLDANGNIVWRENSTVNEKKLAALQRELGGK